MHFVFIFRGLGLVFFFFSLILKLLFSKTARKKFLGRDEQVGAKCRRKKMTLFPIRNTNVSVLTTCGKHGMLPFDLASGTLINLYKEMFRLTKQ